MFDPKGYREDCARLALGQEKIEEMIQMTENENKKSVRRPLRVALIAAAAIALLTATAFAAVPAVQQLFISYVVTVHDGNIQGGGNMIAPVIQSYSEDGRNYLVVNDETIDITQELAKNGSYSMKTEDGFQISVDGNGLVTVEGNDLSYCFNPGETDTDGIPTDGEELEGGDIGRYTITTDENGAVSVSPAE